MTTAAICATREVSWWPSFYRGEQYDSDLGLYYLRARYYNPNTGRFMSRDPEDGKAADPKSLHKYLYAGGDPVNGWDPTGRSDLAETGIVTFTDALKVVWYAAKVICFEIKWIGWITTGIAKATGGTPPLPWWLTFGCTPIGGFGFPSL
jgi:RHS repeat-associated protein